MEASNKLFPVFLKLENLTTRIVGGGYVGTEKLNAIIRNSPDAKVKVVAIDFSEDILSIAKQYPNITLVEKKYTEADNISGFPSIKATSCSK